MKKSKKASGDAPFWQLGKAYFIQTCTLYYTGRLIRIEKDGLVLSEAAWIADTGRFSDALEKATLSEVEPIPGRQFVATGAIVGASEWNHDLPRLQK